MSTARQLSHAPFSGRTLAGPRPPVATASPRLQRKCSCGGSCESCRKKKKEVQRRTLAGRSIQGGELAPPIVQRVLRSPGQPLEGAVRREMESRFGHDLSRVRIHAGPRAAESAAAVEAEAYTVGRHVAFGAGKFVPGTSAGRELLAHELAHTLQQGHGEAPPGRLEINHPGGSDEREAEALSRRAVAGGVAAEPREAASLRLQRKALATVRQKTKPNATACLVHLHADEKNALFTATTLHRQRCANLVFIEHQGLPAREVTFETKVAGEDFSGTADPNRIFTDEGVKAQAESCVAETVRQINEKNKGRKMADRIKFDPTFKAAAQTSFEGEIEAFRGDFSQKISTCRGGSGTKDLSGKHPVVAFHNNTDDAEKSRPGLNIGTFQGSSSAAAVTGNPSILKPDPQNPLTDRDNFLLVTDPGDFAALKADFNVVQQATGLKGATRTVGRGTSAKTVPDRKKDDGSLSVALENERYLNVESQVRTGEAFRIVNLDMGNRVLDHLKVPKEPCAKSAPKAGGPTSAAGGLSAGMALALTQWIAKEKARVAAQKATLPKALPKDPVLPAAVQKLVAAKRCVTFADQAALDTARKAHEATVAGMKKDEVARWMTGIDKPRKWVTDEVGRQSSCLQTGLEAAAAVKGSGISSPKALIGSEHRPFEGKGGQLKIWTEKLTFTRRGKWGRITDTARERCPGLVQAGEEEWNSKDAAHKDCFLNLLTNEERQKEILQTSSAPGISRHHYGTEFDFVNMTPADWESGRTGKDGWADEYSWLQRNASTYGFFQPFTAESNFLRLGYIEERWHWSYYPISQALLEWAKVKANQGEIASALATTDWSKHPDRYTFLQQHEAWKAFLLNVDETPRF